MVSRLLRNSVVCCRRGSTVVRSAGEGGPTDAGNSIEPVLFESFSKQNGHHYRTVQGWYGKRLNWPTQKECAFHFQVPVQFWSKPSTRLLTIYLILFSLSSDLHKFTLTWPSAVGRQKDKSDIVVFLDVEEMTNIYIYILRRDVQRICIINLK